MSPIIPAPAADPWMIYHDGWYYFCENRNQRSIHVRKSRHILDIGRDDGVMVRPPQHSGPASRNVWAPELHFINGRWYIYYAADDGVNENHRMWVMESETIDPQGAYRCRGMLQTDGWAIDGTVLELQGALYFIWSGWPGEKDGLQNLYIAPMKNPWTLAGPRRLLTTPEQNWEKIGMPICEGPQILKRGGSIFIIYSASGSWTVDYCLGMLCTTSSDVLNPAVWKKTGPVFKKSESIWGVGHCSFVTSPCRGDDWMLYHAKTSRAHGWKDRHVHAQRFTWTPDGIPHFGSPAPAARPAHVIFPERPISAFPDLCPEPTVFPNITYQIQQ